MTFQDLFDNPTKEYLFTVRYETDQGEVVEYYDSHDEAVEEAQSMDEVHGWEVVEMISPDSISFKWSDGEFIKEGVAFDDHSDYVDAIGRAMWEGMQDDEFDCHRLGTGDYSDALDTIEEEIGAKNFYKYCF